MTKYHFVEKCQECYREFSPSGDEDGTPVTRFIICDECKKQKHEP
jgi:hypothetical protein